MDNDSLLRRAGGGTQCVSCRSERRRGEAEHEERGCARREREEAETCEAVISCISTVAPAGFRSRQRRRNCSPRAAASKCRCPPCRPCSARSVRPPSDCAGTQVCGSRTRWMHPSSRSIASASESGSSLLGSCWYCVPCPWSGRAVRPGCSISVRRRRRAIMDRHPVGQQEQHEVHDVRAACPTPYVPSLIRSAHARPCAVHQCSQLRPIRHDDEHHARSRARRRGI
eukprot:SAG31_NODE_947_length_10828_cov_3.713953_6_plen_227_part_00